MRPSRPTDGVVRKCLEVLDTAVCILSLVVFLPFLAFLWACMLLTISGILILVQIVWLMGMAFWAPFGGVMLLWCICGVGLIELRRRLQWTQAITARSGHDQ